jgi:O-antigen/teichoic acid export membrane protein
MPAELYAESERAIGLLALSLPFVLSAAGLQGVLEAYQRFHHVNAVRLPMGVAALIGPLLILPYTHSVAAMTAVLAITRIAAWAALVALCWQPVFAARPKVRISLVLPLLRMGGWMTVSNAVSPIMVYVDRLLIGALLSMTAVTYYAAPYDVITKLWIIPSSLLSVLFPAFAIAALEPGRLAQLFKRGVHIVFLVMFPLALTIVTFAPEGITIWLGAEFAQQSTSVLRWLTVGVLINSIGWVPFALIQGVGRPDLTAKMHLVEAPLYLVVLWYLVSVHGVVGAAVAWTLRLGIETVVLWVLALQWTGEPIRYQLALAGAVVMTVLTAGALLQGLAVKVGFVFVAYLVFGAVAWVRILDPQLRSRIATIAASVRVRLFPSAP